MLPDGISSELETASWTARCRDGHFSFGTFPVFDLKVIFRSVLFPDLTKGPHAADWRKPWTGGCRLGGPMMEGLFSVRSFSCS